MAVQPTTTEIKKTTGGLMPFLRDTKNELKKVIWPTRKELSAYTVVVIIATLFVALALWIIDGVFAQLFRLLMGVH